MATKKIVFLGSKPIGYECLSYLISQQKVLNITVVGILTRVRKEFGEGRSLYDLAATNNIAILSSLDDITDCDIIYSVQYHQLLEAQHIAKASELCVNLHMAPLPEYRGANQFTFAILDEKKEFGTTIHKIDTRIDHGDILFEKRFLVPDNCWVNDLYQLTFEASVQLFRETLADVIKGNYQLQPQGTRIGQFGSSLHFRKEMEDLRVIDLSWGKEKTERHIRATSMPGFEPPYCIVDGEKIFFTRTPRQN